MEICVNSTSARAKSLQADLLQQISEMLKTTACMDDASAKQINNIIRQLDVLVECLSEDSDGHRPNPPLLVTPKLTIV